MFEIDVHIHPSTSRAVEDNLLWSIFFQNFDYTVHVVICCKVFPLNAFLTFSPFKCIANQILPFGKTGQSQRRVIIYINFVELESLMLHAKFQDHRRRKRRFWQYIGMAAILAMRPRFFFKKCMFPLPRRFHIEFDFDWPSGLRERNV